jgi:chromosome segregation ATPase
MSEEEKTSQVYGVRLTGELYEEVDVYIENSDASKSDSLKRLLELGLEVEEVGGGPEDYRDAGEELWREFVALREEHNDARDELHEERSARASFRASATMAYGTVIALALWIAYLPEIRAQIGPVPDLVNQIVFFATTIIFMGGFFIYVEASISPVEWVQGRLSSWRE